MKKIFTLTALPLCALLAFGACANRTDTPSEPADPSSTQVSVQELTEAREHAGALKAELDEMNQLLQIEQTEKQALSDRVDELEDALAAALEGKEGSETPDNNEDEPFLERALANGATLIYRAGVSDGPVYSEHLADEMKVRYADGTETEIGTSLTSVEVSPDGTRLLYNDGFAGNFDAADGAEPGSLYVYDFDSRRASWLELDGLREGYTPAFADWLDDRYILFVEQLASGAFTVGGDLCVYDTENDTFRRLTHTARENFQIRSFEIFGRDYLVFNCTQYDEAYIGMDSHPILVMAELYELIRDGKTVDLRERVTDS